MFTTGIGFTCYAIIKSGKINVDMVNRLQMAKEQSIQQTKNSKVLNQSQERCHSESFSRQSIGPIECRTHIHVDSYTLSHKGENNESLKKGRYPDSHTNMEKSSSHHNPVHSLKRSGKRKIHCTLPSSSSSQLKEHLSVKPNMHDANLPDIQSEYVGSGLIYQFNDPAEKTFYDVTTKPNRLF